MAGRPKILTEEMEAKIFHLRESGKTWREIADRLNISLSTAKTAMTNARHREGLHTLQVTVPESIDKIDLIELVEGSPSESAKLPSMEEIRDWMRANDYKSVAYPKAINGVLEAIKTLQSS